MKTRKIKDKNNNDYIVEVDESSFKKDTQKGYPSWSAEYSVKNEGGKRVGFGSLRVICLSEHEHLEDEKMFDSLVTLGAFKIKKSIDNGEPIESVGYNIQVDNCRK